MEQLKQGQSEKVLLNLIQSLELGLRTSAETSKRIADKLNINSAEHVLDLDDIEISKHTTIAGALDYLVYKLDEINDFNRYLNNRLSKLV